MLFGENGSKMIEVESLGAGFILESKQLPNTFSLPIEAVPWFSSQDNLEIKVIQSTLKETGNTVFIASAFSKELAIEAQKITAGDKIINDRNFYRIVHSIGTFSASSIPRLQNPNSESAIFYSKNSRFLRVFALHLTNVSIGAHENIDITVRIAECLKNREKNVLKKISTNPNK